MPDEICTALIAWLDSGPAKCTQAEATSFTARLLARYPDAALKDFQGEKGKSFKLYGMQIYEAFCGFSSRVCEAALALPDGSLAKLDYTPRVPEIIKALIAEQDRLALMKANAKSHMAERKRRHDADRERREFEAKLPSLEERRAQVARLLGNSVRTMP